MRPKFGMVLNLLGAIALGAATLIEETVTSTGGVLPLRFLTPFAAAAFVVRFTGLANAQRRGEPTMSWLARSVSWVLFGVPGALLGIAGSAPAVAALATFFVLDAAGGLSKRRPKGSVAPVRKRKSGFWKRARLPLVVVLYLTLVALIHVSVSVYFPFGTLMTWSLLALGFALLLRFSIAGPKATEHDLRAPMGHRRHERRIETIADPQRERAEAILLQMRANGDMTSFLDLVAEAARIAELPDHEVEDLKRRVHATFARAGTRRDEDVMAALAEVERALTPAREVPVTAPRKEASA